MLVEEDVGELIVKFNVTVESQPDVLATVVVYEPLVVYVLPFKAHVYGPHALTVCVDVELVEIVKSK